MRKIKLTTALFPAAVAAMPASWAGQFGDYKPTGSLSDYSKLEPKGGASEAYTKQAMDHWAEGLRKTLDRWHGKASPEK